MELKELMMRIGNNDIPSFNIWYGEEQKLIDLYIEKLSSDYLVTISDSVQFVLSRIGVRSLDTRPKCWVVIDDFNFTKADNKWKDVSALLQRSKDILICRFNKVDKRTKFISSNKEYSVEFKTLEDSILSLYVQRKMNNLNDKNIKRLINICSSSLGRIYIECDKILDYCKALNITDENIAFVKLVEDSIITSDIGDITFKLTDSVLYGDTKNAIKYLEQANKKNEPPLLIASVLYKGFRNMLMVQGLGKDKTNASKRTNLDNWQVRQAMNNIGAYTIKELERNMLLCQEFESKIKTGFLDIDNQLDYLIVGCLR